MLKCLVVQLLSIKSGLLTEKYNFDGAVVKLAKIVCSVPKWFGGLSDIL